MAIRGRPLVPLAVAYVFQREPSSCEIVGFATTMRGRAEAV